jgi:hypothetical protein
MEGPPASSSEMYCMQKLILLRNPFIFLGGSPISRDGQAPSRRPSRFFDPLVPRQRFLSIATGRHERTPPRLVLPVLSRLQPSQPQHDMTCCLLHQHRHYHYPVLAYLNPVAIAHRAHSKAQPRKPLCVFGPR